MLPDPQTRSLQAQLVLRVAISAIIAAHGVSRFWFDAVDPFGIWLTAQGIPAGHALAYGITALEIFGTPLLALGFFVSPLCLLYATVYFFGIILVHAPEGWFVVGLGRNGMEYSVLLIVCLLGIGYQHLPERVVVPVNQAYTTHLAIRPWWLNLIWLFCLYMTFIYMPWDFFLKPSERWEEVWFGFTIRGWYAKATEPIHWLIYAAGSYGIWKMRPWLWPWISLYSAQIAIAMLIFNFLEGPEMGDGRGGGPFAAVPIFLFFSYLTWVLWRSKDLFNNPAR